MCSFRNYKLNFHQGKIPIDYIRATCLKCKEPLVRDYLAQHVESSFSIDEREAWNIVNLIAKHEDNLQ